jgi:hypothetical protein
LIWKHIKSHPILAKFMLIFRFDNSFLCLTCNQNLKPQDINKFNGPIRNFIKLER